MEKCYEYFDCKNKDCKMFNKENDNKNCWEVKGTLCTHPGLKLLVEQNNNKIDVCKNCIYYKSMMK